METPIRNEQTRLIPYHPTRDTLEAYREIRTNLLSKLKKETGNTIIVASCNYLEKQLNAAINLSASFANLGRSVLLIDCDCLQKSLSKLMPASSDFGLSNYLRNQASYETVIQQSDCDRLSVIYSGNAEDCMEDAIAADRFQALLARAKTEFEFIFLSGPPLSISPAMLPLCQECDGTILVVKEMISKHTKIAEVLNKLSYLSSDILGFIYTK